MPRSSTLTYDDSDRYQQAVRSGRTELFVTAAGGFHGELTKVDLERLWIQRGADSLARIARVAVDTRRAPITFLADSNLAPIQHAGMEVKPGEIVVYGAGAVDIQRTQAATRWAAMSLTPEEWARVGQAIAGRPFEIPAESYCMRPGAAAMQRLVALHEAAGRLAKSDPAALANSETARALEQQMLYAMVTCLNGDAAETRRSWQHAKVIVRFEDFLASKFYEPVYIAEICAAIGVSARTLRTCCQEHLGMGPVRYLWLRRMHLANRALLRADAAQATVTEIATGHGFWELGRFSVEYRTLFGESPSASLKRPPTLAAPKAH